VREKVVVLGDIKETRISSALSRRVESFVEDCFAAKVFGKVFWYRSRSGRGEAAQTEIYTQN
jgi:hypothetical protein